NGYEGEGKTSCRKSEPTMQFHAGIAPGRPVIGGEFAGVAFGSGQDARLSSVKSTELDGPVATSEVRDRVVVSIFPGILVRGAGLQMQLQLALIRFGNYNRVLRQGKTRSVLSACFREKNAVPLRPAGRNVVDVQHQARETF